MSRNPSPLYKYHVANLRALQLAINSTLRLAKEAVATKDPQKSLQSLLRLISFLIGAWAETRLNKILHEEFGFNDSHRQKILDQKSQLDKWNKCIELAFRSHYKIIHADLTDSTLGVANFARYTTLQNIISNDLRIIIEIRNKLAHGQWIYPLTSNGSDVEKDKYKLIKHENIQTLHFKYDLLKHLANLIHDLVVSSRTFERDFEIHYKKLKQVQINSTKKTYADYEQKLIQNRIDGRKKALNNAQIV